MLSHILIDLLDPGEGVQRKIKDILNSTCRSVFSDDEVKLELYYCEDSIVFIYRYGDNLLLDLIGGERVFDKLLDAIPVQRVVVRLVERGVPSKG